MRENVELQRCNTCTHFIIGPMSIHQTIGASFGCCQHGEVLSQVRAVYARQSDASPMTFEAGGGSVMVHREFGCIHWRSRILTRLELEEGLQRSNLEGHNKIVHNGSWYDRGGTKVGWGDLAQHDLERISERLSESEIFFVVSERDSYWDRREFKSQGLDFVLERCQFVVVRGIVYKVAGTPGCISTSQSLSKFVDEPDEDSPSWHWAKSDFEGVREHVLHNLTCYGMQFRVVRRARLRAMLACTSIHCTDKFSPPGIPIMLSVATSDGNVREFTSTDHQFQVGHHHHCRLTRESGEDWEVVEARPRCANGQYHAMLKLVDGAP